VESRGAILITGASGFIGRRVARAALERGYETRTLSRREWEGEPRVPLAWRFLGALPHNIPEAAFAGARALVHLANTTGSEDDATARAVNVEGPRRLAALAARHGLERIVYISSQSAREDAISAYGKTKLEAERALFSAGEGRKGAEGVKPPPVVVLRPGLVYGMGAADLYSRMARSVRRLPVIPLIGGGRALVQAVHVDDLAEAILRCVESGGRLDGRVLRIGDPRPVPLREFLGMIARAQTSGRGKMAISIPLAPLITTVGAAERLGLKLPISVNNLLGLKKVESMETRADLEALGLELRPLEPAIREIEAAKARGGASRAGEAAADAPPPERPARVAIVGAGRIALLHALTLTRLRGLRLAALVDTNPKAPKFLRGVGVEAPAFRSLDEARRATRLDGAIVSTPPRSHLPLAEALRRAGLAALVEKPLANSPATLEVFRRFSPEDASKIQVGYLTLTQPHLRRALDRLARGEFGRVTGFEAVSLQSLFPGARRWEADPAAAGGGALINLGCHTLSLIVAAFGPPERVEAQRRRVTSARVEDSMVIRLEYKGFSGLYCVSWAIEGYGQAENRLVIQTDRGELTLSNTVAAFRRAGAAGFDELDTQLDYESGFNPAPDYIGGGLTAELAEFGALLREGAAPSVPLARAIEIEEALFSIYRASEEREPFTLGAEKARETGAAAPPAPRESGAAPAFLLDLRGLEPADLNGVRLADILARGYAGFTLWANQIAPARRAGVAPEAMSAVIPDFVNSARRLNSGNFGAFFRSLGAGASLALAWQGGWSVLRERGATFWAVAEALLAADLARTPRDFRGELLLHAFLVDLAAGLGQTRRLNALLGRIRACRPQSRVGVQTASLPQAMDALVYLRHPLSAVHFLSSPRAPGLPEAIATLRADERFSRARFCAGTWALPSSLLPAAAANPQDWTHGAEAISFDASAHPELARRRRARLEAAWSAAFPGAAFPPAAL